MKKLDAVEDARIREQKEPDPEAKLYDKLTFLAIQWNLIENMVWF